MKYFELLISLVFGAVLFPVILLITGKIGIGIMTFPLSLVLYYLGGYYIGKKMKLNSNITLSIFFGISPLILIVIFLFNMEWINEGNSYLFLLFSLLIMYISYLGVKKGNHHSVHS